MEREMSKKNPKVYTFEKLSPSHLLKCLFIWEPSI